MPRFCAILSALLGASLIAGCGPSVVTPSDDGSTAGVDGAGDAQPGAFVSDELIVAVTPGASDADLADLYSDAGVAVRERLAELSMALLGVDPAGRLAASETLLSSPLIEAVYDNTLVAAPATLVGVDGALAWGLDAVDAPAAWETSTGAGVLVAVLDSGVQSDHPALARHIVGGANTESGGAADDVIGHGTRVAGVIAADADTVGDVFAVAPDAMLLNVRVTDDAGRATSWSTAAGIALAVNNGARVINVSYGPFHDDEVVLRQASLAALHGALVVFAAGNDGARANGGADDVLFVGAVDAAGARAEFSSYGPFLDLVAPGVDVYTTTLDGAYGAYSGTSFASPIVAGVAALVCSANPDLRAGSVRGALLASATDLGPTGDDEQYGAGLVNAERAVELAEGLEEVADATPPTVSITAPTSGASASGLMTVSVAVADDSDLADVTLYLDSRLIAMDVAPPYAFVINTDNYEAMAHVIQVEAVDVFGNEATASQGVTFLGPPDGQPPSVRILSPSAGDTVSGRATVIAETVDDRELAKATILLDGVVLTTLQLGGPLTRLAWTWTVGAAVTDGAHTLTVRVTDAAGNAGEAQTSVSVRQ